MSITEENREILRVAPRSTTADGVGSPVNVVGVSPGDQFVPPSEPRLLLALDELANAIEVGFGV